MLQALYGASPFHFQPAARLPRAPPLALVAGRARASFSSVKGAGADLSMDILWKPDPQRQAAALLTAFARTEPETAAYAETFDYPVLHAWSVARREAFWSKLWDFCEIIGEKGEPVLEEGEKMPGARWFPQARL